MFLTHRKKLIICHCMPGRMRVKAEPIRASKDNAAEMEKWLSAQAHLSRIQACPATANVILYYNIEKTDADKVLDLVYKALDALSFPLKKAPERQKKTFTGRIVELSLITAFTGYTLVRKFVLNSPLPQGAFSMVSVVSLVGAVPLFTHSLEDLRQGKGLSIFPFLASACVLAIVMGESMAALEVIWIFRIGMLLEDYVSEKSKRAIRETFQVADPKAYVLVDGAEIEVESDSLRAGEIVVVRTGEKIPADGVIIAGEALVDEAHITGRAVPEVRIPDHQVFAGTFVRNGMIHIRAEKTGDDTYLSRTIRSVETALANRAPVEKQADILAMRLFRLGILAVAGTFVLTADPIRAVTVMIVMACPCATVLAASTAVSAALANAARNRSLIKGGCYLETVGKADCYCFDKTGTITESSAGVADVLPLIPGQSREEILRLAASLVSHHPHPVSKAVTDAAAEYGIPFESPFITEWIPGLGVKAEHEEMSIVVGNERLMKAEGIDTASCETEIQAFLKSHQSALYVARNQKLQGIIAVAHFARPNAKAVIDGLRKDGVSEICLVTGDTDAVAREIADSLGFDEYRAELLPEDKARFIDQLKNRGRQVVMVGDGINDALALSHSDVGIAMGAGGAEAAIEAADIAIVDSELERLIEQRQLSRQTIRVINQNYYLAFSTNIVGIILGAAGFLSPVGAGSIHIIHTVGIMLNSSRLLDWKPPEA